MTHDDQEQPEYRVYPLGIPGRPLPMLFTTEKETGTGKNKKTGTVTELGVIEDAQNPLRFYSRRPYAEAMGILYRNLPIPSMLPAMLEGIERRTPDSPVHMQMILGMPGIGKTTMPEVLALARDPRGAILVDCGGKNLNDLLVFETVLDADRNRSLYAKIDELARDNKLHASSRRALLQGLPNACTETADGRVSIDWEAINNTPESGLKEVMDIIHNVLGWEGISGQYSSLMVTTQPGPLQRAKEQGREMIADEYTKAKVGTDGSYQLLMQVLNGERASHTMRGPDGKTFTLSRQDFDNGLFVTYTGNLSNDGSSTHGLAASTYERAAPHVFDDPALPTPLDWQHRLCQFLTGLPVSTLFYCAEPYWRSNPAEFTKFLMEMRTVGLSQEEIANIPSWQFSNIKNWTNVMQFSTQMATCFSELSQLTNPESEMLKQSQFREISMEVDRAYSAEIGIGFRMAKRLIQQSLSVTAEPRTAQESKGFWLGGGTWHEVPALNMSAEPAEARQGDRFARKFREEVRAKTHGRGRPATGRQADAILTKAGVFPAAGLKEGMPSDVKDVGALLNYDPREHRSETETAEDIQTILCDYLRTHYPDINVTDNDAIIPLAVVQEVLAEVRQFEPVLNERAGQIVVNNPSVDGAHDIPLGSVVVHDALLAGGERLELPVDRLCNQEVFLLSMSLPEIGEINKGALWNRALSSSGLISYDPAKGLDDEALAMAQKESQTGLAVTTVLCARHTARGAQPSPVHIVEDTVHGITLMVGDRIDPRTRRNLSRGGIVYVERGTHESALAVQETLDRMLSGQPEDTAAHLKHAFLMRNEASAAHSTRNPGLAELMAGDEASYCVLPVYVTASPELEQALGGQSPSRS